MLPQKSGLELSHDIFVLIVVLLLCCGNSSTAAQPRSNAHPPETEGRRKQDKYQAVDWRLLWFTKERQIEKISITLFDMNASPWKKTGIAGIDGLRFETRDPAILRTVQEGLTLPLRRGIPDEAGWGAGGNAYCAGFANISTNKDSFIVGITYSGFTLNSRDYRMQNVFYSWLFAKQLDDIVLRETKQSIPRRVFDVLSGEAIIQSAKSKYRLIRINKEERERREGE